MKMPFPRPLTNSVMFARATGLDIRQAAERLQNADTELRALDALASIERFAQEARRRLSSPAHVQD